MVLHLFIDYYLNGIHSFLFIYLVPCKMNAGRSKFSGRRTVHKGELQQQHLRWLLHWLQTKSNELVCFVEFF